MMSLYSELNIEHSLISRKSVKEITGYAPIKFLLHHKLGLRYGFVILVNRGRKFRLLVYRRRPLIYRLPALG